MSQTFPTVTVRAPASKSLSHRFLLGAALAEGVSTVRHALVSDDTDHTRAVLTAAGARFTPLPPAEGGGEGCWRVIGLAGQPRGGTEAAPLDCNVGASGTSCRLLTAVLAAGRGAFYLHGAGRLHQRPMDELLQALRFLGADVRCSGQPGCPPLRINAAGLQPALCGGEVELGMERSSQFFSGLLLAAPLGPAPMAVSLCGQKAVSWPYVGLTLHALEAFGLSFTVETRPCPDVHWQTLPPGGWRGLKTAEPGCLRVTVRPGPYRPGDYSVEGDWSGASYLLAAGALGRRPVRVEGLNPASLQGDRALLDILQKMGARLEASAKAVTVYPSPLHGVDLDMGHCPDLVPTVAVLAAFAGGSTRIRNVAHLRLKESDRISAPATELAKTGVTVDQLSDGLLVHGLAGRGPNRPDHPRLPADATLSAHDDHRMAMSLALLDLREPETHVRARLDDPAVVSKSFPHFWKVWEQLA